MLWLYNIGVHLYYFLLWLASFFNAKAKLWITGRQRQSLVRYHNSIWFHFASLGEFEQGRPVLEKLREAYPGRPVIITFFSPSGYEIRKNTPLADAVYYLPLDTAANARKFINTIQPGIAIFTKYEYWYHFFNTLHQQQIPLYIISAIFRKEQVFFQWYGGLHRKILGFVTYFFVQDENSKNLLSSIKIKNAAISGDTRFDRVWANAQQPKPLPQIAAFVNSSPVFICGSTWPEDEKLLTTLLTDYPDYKFIFAPHEIQEERVSNLFYRFEKGTAMRYAQIPENIDTKIRVLIIDNIGLLSALYQYGHIAYIGGGFGVGIHNTLEAAAFGLPVVFGPNYLKFKEARDLVALQTGFTIGNEHELKKVVSQLVTDEEFYNDTCKKAKGYVDLQKGATNVIVHYIIQNNKA